MNNKNDARTTIFRLGIASFINDLSSEIILPIIPMFLLSLGGTPVIIGLLAGLRQLAVSVFLLLGAVAIAFGC